MPKYFTLEELCHSEAAIKHNINNTPGKEASFALAELILYLLDPLRELWGGPIRVNSGYRCPALNRLIGGVSTSQHVKGQAADITVGSKAKNKRLFDLLLSSGLPFDQAIDEKNYQWIHVSLNMKNNRKQILHL